MRIARSMLLIVTVILAAWSAGAQDIFDAIRSNDLAKAKAFVEKDAALIRAKDASGNTPLHAAAIAGSVQLAAWLIAGGAVVDADNLESVTPLFEAIRNEKDDVAILLIDWGADIEKNGGALIRAALRNRRAVAERLIAKGADIEKKQGEYTPLGLIARSGANSFDVFELLVKKGADLNPRDSFNNTPLDNALAYGCENRIIDLLLDRRAEVNTDPASLQRMLPAAAQRGHLRLFEYYRAHGGEALFADDSNRLGFMRSAILGGSLELVKTLQGRNIPLDHRADSGGMTPLHRISFSPRAVGMIEFLVRNGADINARTNDGRSAYNVAVESGNGDAAALLARLGASTEPQKFPVLTGPYLGQIPPGDRLLRFAQGIINPDHGTIAFSPDGQEAYWPTGTSIMMMKVQDGRWTRPAYAPFSGPRDIPFYDDVPFVTPDSKRLFFMSKRPLGSETSQKENIWFVERTRTGWAEPRPVDAAVNAMRQHWQISVSNSGTLYFASGAGDLYCSRLVDGRYTQPVELGPAINTKDGESQPFIAPDESYILFYRVFGQVPSAFVSFKGKNGEWLPAVKVELPWAGAGLMVSSDGKYLFAGGLWKSAKFLDDLRPKSEEGAKRQER